MAEYTVASVMASAAEFGTGILGMTGDVGDFIFQHPVLLLPVFSGLFIMGGKFLLSLIPR